MERNSMIIGIFIGAATILVVNAVMDRRQSAAQPFDDARRAG